MLSILEWRFDFVCQTRTRAQLLLRWPRNVAQIEFSLSSGGTSL